MEKPDKVLYAPLSLLVAASPKLNKDWLIEAMITPVNDEGRVSIIVKEPDWESWQIFLYWLLKREVPQHTHNDQMLLVRCWVLGECLQVPDFMDDVMLRLLLFYDVAGNSITVEVARYALCRTKSSALDVTKTVPNTTHIRVLVVEELLKSEIIKSEHDIQEVGLDKCRRGHEDCGISELPGLLDFLGDWHGMHPGLSRDRFGQGGLGKVAVWMYMMASDKWRDMRELMERRIRVLFIPQSIDTSS
jgi:hypothetical protein